MTSFASLPSGHRYFEDFTQGATYPLGSIAVELDEVLAFAGRYDPQYFHLDAERAKAGPFGALSASGWHTVGLQMRLFAENFLSAASSLGSPGVGAIKWLKPVYPGDVLTVQTTVREARVSRSKPDRGLVTVFTEVFNQGGDPVMTLEATVMMKLRPPA